MGTEAELNKAMDDVEMLEHAIKNIREFSSMIPLHTEDEHIIHFVEQIESWCEYALNGPNSP